MFAILFEKETSRLKLAAVVVVVMVMVMKEEQIDDVYCLREVKVGD